MKGFSKMIGPHLKIFLVDGIHRNNSWPPFN